MASVVIAGSLILTAFIIVRNRLVGKHANSLLSCKRESVRQVRVDSENRSPRYCRSGLSAIKLHLEDLSPPEELLAYQSASQSEYALPLEPGFLVHLRPRTVPAARLKFVDAPGWGQDPDPIRGGCPYFAGRTRDQRRRRISLSVAEASRSTVGPGPAGRAKRTKGGSTVKCENLHLDAENRGRSPLAHASRQRPRMGGNSVTSSQSNFRVVPEARAAACGSRRRAPHLCGPRPAGADHSCG